MGNEQSVYYLGPEGSYSYLMAKSLFGESKAKLIALDTTEDVINRVVGNKNVLGLIPIENSITSDVHKHVDQVFKNSLLKIAGEAYLQINLHAIGQKDASREDIKKAYSHPQALEQVSKYLGQNAIEPIQSKSTSDAQKQIIERGDRAEIVIGNKTLAEHPNLKIIDENVGNERKNLTRFLLVSSNNEIELSPESNKATIHFRIDNKDKSFTNLFSKLNEKNVGLSKIISRPVPGTEFEYDYWADLDISVDDLASVLSIFEENAKDAGILGVYKKGKVYSS